VFRRRDRIGACPAKVVGLLVAVWSAGPSQAQAQAAGDATRPVAVSELIRYEHTGLSLISPHARGKIPVLFIHGLWSNPASWHRTITKLGKDPALREKYQFWTFGYSTGDPIPYSAYLLRRDLDGLRRMLDPDRSDAALDRMVVVGHSMGGLIARMMVTQSGERIWRVVSDRPVGELQGPKADIELFRSGLIFEARPEVRRVVYIATPHRGSRFDRGPIERLGTRLVRVQDPLRAAHDRLVSQNGAMFFREFFRKGMPTSIDELEWGSPILSGLIELSSPPAVKAHSIVAVRPGAEGAERTDGLVTYESAHLAGVVSETIVRAGHLCQDHPDVIEEVGRVLGEHTAR
jgi:pimeloyl-ACP methyl ester carboxylesterase